MDLPFDLTTGQGAFLAAALFAAAFVRGYSGFGFSAIFIVFAALVTNPVPLIPVVFSCEIAMTAFQARGIRANIDWTRVLPLLFGAAIATVPAVAIMASLGEAQARIAVSVMVLSLSLVLLSGWRMRRPVDRVGNIGFGACAGIANSAGVGGLPTAAFFAAQGMAPAVFRATMIVFLTGLDLFALPVMGAHGLIGSDTAIGIAMAFPILGLGIWVGTQVFRVASQAQFRKVIILMLTALSILNLGKVMM